MSEIVECSKNKFLHFRNEKARFWAENTFDEEGRNFVDWFTKHMKRDQSYLVFHPDDDSTPENVPEEFQGIVIQFPMSEGMKEMAN